MIFIFDPLASSHKSPWSHEIPSYIPNGLPGYNESSGSTTWRNESGDCRNAQWCFLIPWWCSVIDGINICVYIYIDGISSIRITTHIYIYTHIILILGVKSRFFFKIDKWWYYLCDVISEYRTPLIDDRSSVIAPIWICPKNYGDFDLHWNGLERYPQLDRCVFIRYIYIYIYFFFFDLLVFFKDWIRTWKWDRLVEEWLKFHARSYGIWWDLMGYTYLVRGLEHLDYFSIQLGMSSSQLTFIHSIIFQTG